MYKFEVLIKVEWDGGSVCYKKLEVSANDENDAGEKALEKINSIPKRYVIGSVCDPGRWKTTVESVEKL